MATSSRYKAHRPHPRDGLSAELSSEGIQRTTIRHLDARRSPQILRKGLRSKWVEDRPFPTLNASGMLSTSSKWRRPRASSRRSLWRKAQRMALASVRKIFSWNCHRLDHTTAQSSLCSKSFGTSLKIESVLRHTASSSSKASRGRASDRPRAWHRALTASAQLYRHFS